MPVPVPSSLRLRRWGADLFPATRAEAVRERRETAVTTTTMMVENDEGNFENDSPSPPTTWTLTVEYCTGCRWMLRASYLACELLTTFRNDAGLHGVVLVQRGPPSWPGGIFRVSAAPASSADDRTEQRILLWDRNVEKRFPESKELKQIVRDLVDPEKDLGHSDVKEKADGASGEKSDGGETAAAAALVAAEDCVECRENSGTGSGADAVAPAPTISDGDMDDSQDARQNNVVTVEYSSNDPVLNENWLYRANWYAQEILTMKDEIVDDSAKGVIPGGEMEVGSVALVPNRSEEGGVFCIRLNKNDVLYDRGNDSSSSFADAGEIKRRIRSAFAGDMTIDDDGGGGGTSSEDWEDDMDDDEAEEARRFFGVM